ncbi:COG1242: Predicted Fe-S oxidoreductase [Halanaerobium saccharolyticum subsp. saccharolyticum DSM 6643]|uniref:COG1242: Predicted Fe-S oxidoreductase n=1 Tax=Halanaerobium saccharolyticum subsp. saccharolyticum DSM 6643 TaxID=1293054 RepID=M5EAQ9_9FIRM|nr:TIGR01212 family radical SAM protein [Halanaerobium saccharolyticum]CCU77827.1 COG1242: Predicted Fe-S oxidoreductase [Halanaerobium saccharolyticum subsp. saccharolyticum DSM 6643]
MGEPYYKYSQFLKDKYGKKTYKLPVNLPTTCPNRDGNLAKAGCHFCGEEGADFEMLPDEMSVTNQLLENKEYIGERYGVDQFIAYFQNYTNTYLELNKLKNYIKEAAKVEGIKSVYFSTRPDSISDQYISTLKNILQEISSEIELAFEFGLQTVNYKTLKNVNRQHGLAEFIDAVLRAKRFEVEVGAHLILNLPGDTREDVIEGARILSALEVDHVKLHALYIRENSVFAKKYKAGELEICSLAEYIERVILFLENLSPDIAVQRLIGRAPGEESIFVNWDTPWWKIHDMIIKEMKKRNTYQGRLFNYLNGKALSKFQTNNN